MTRMYEATFFAALLLALPACSPSAQPAQSPAVPQASSVEPAAEAKHEPGPIGTKLMRDVSDSEHAFEVGENRGTGLGDYDVKLDGKAIWPPTGNGCDKLVSCCSALAQLAKPLALACLLATARDKDCKLALTTASGIAAEQSYTLPASCAH